MTAVTLCGRKLEWVWGWGVPMTINRLLENLTAGEEDDKRGNWT